MSNTIFSKESTSHKLSDNNDSKRYKCVITLTFLKIMILNCASVASYSGWTTGRSRFDPQQRRKDFFFHQASVSRPALGPTQPTVQWVPGVLSPGGKARPGRDADNPRPSSAEVENEYELYLFSPQAPPLRLVGQL
jgi:hypothetical protein